MIKRCDYCGTRALSFAIICEACRAPFPTPRFVGGMAIYDSKTLAMIDEWERIERQNMACVCIHNVRYFQV